MKAFHKLALLLAFVAVAMTFIYVIFGWHLTIAICVGAASLACMRLIK